MKYGSVCSGIEAATVAWESLGWKAQFFSEIEKFPCVVLKHHYPNVPLHGDFTTIKEGNYGPIELLVGGTPCQSFSVAGLRKGMDDDRGNLALEYLKLAQRLRPRWVVWENVPGVLSSNEGRDFGAFLGGLEELGYGWAYRTLDAQFAGVPQRRRRVFVIGYLGDWRLATAVLFERHSLQGNIAPSREKREGTPEATGGGVEICSPLAARDYKDPGVDGCSKNSAKMIPVYNLPGFEIGPGGGNETDIAPTLDARCKDGPIRNQIGLAVAVRTAQTSANGRGVAEETAHTLDGTQGQAVAHTFKVRSGCEGGGKGYLGQDDKAFTVATGQDQHLFNNMQVRRLTPKECERLQGFPDNYTRISWRGKSPENCPDGPRYKALGNSMAVPVMRWIGERIQKVEDIINENER